MANWIPPNTIKGVREFLGFTGYYRRFVPTTQQSRNLWYAYWGKTVNLNGQMFARTLSRPCARFSSKLQFSRSPRKTCHISLIQDASDYGIGGALWERNTFIAYYSKSLNPAQQKYCMTRRELLAVVATLDHFKGYVWGPKFVVRTDHAGLVWLKNLKNIQGMLA